MLKIYTDGACSGNPGPGGWAFVIPAKNIEQSGYEYDTTNNRMEITACIEALELALSYIEIDDVEIITDSQYVVNTMTLNWQRKKNTDLWKKLDWLISKFRKIKWTWVKGHADNKYNQRCDELAVAEYKNEQNRLEQLKKEKEHKYDFCFDEELVCLKTESILLNFEAEHKYKSGNHIYLFLKNNSLPNLYIVEKDEKELICSGDYDYCMRFMQRNSEEIPF